MLLNILTEIERTGFRSAIDEAKMTSGGFLAIITFFGLGAPVSLQLEISLREKKTKAPGAVITIVSDFLPAYTIIHLPREELVLEKIKALFMRKKPRDFYDLYFLLRGGLIAPKQRSLLSKAQDILKSSKAIAFEKELKQFLPKSHWPVIRNFSEALDQELTRYTGK
jgi:hypothetical protein